MFDRLRQHFREIRRIRQEYRNFNKTRKAIKKANPPLEGGWDHLGAWRDQ